MSVATQFEIGECVDSELGVDLQQAAPPGSCVGYVLRRATGRAMAPYGLGGAGPTPKV